MDKKEDCENKKLARFTQKFEEVELTHIPEVTKKEIKKQNKDKEDK